MSKELYTRNRVEDAIDEVGFMNFMVMVEEICHQKSRENSDDEKVANLWVEAAGRVLQANDEKFEDL